MRVRSSNSFVPNILMQGKNGLCVDVLFSIEIKFFFFFKEKKQIIKSVYQLFIRGKKTQTEVLSFLLLPCR